MDRANYVDLFSVPPDYQEPEDGVLDSDTHYPNLNSKDYRKRTVEKVAKIKPFFESFDVNHEGNAVLASNEIRSRYWDGSIWGFEDVHDLGIESKACYKLYCKSPATNVMYMESKIFAVSYTSGTVQLWSTQAESRNASGYCLFMVGGKTEHNGIVNTIDLFQQDKMKLASGSSDCCLKIWDSGCADLISIHTMRFAHSDSITSLSCSKTMPTSLVTCSRDKSSLIWDYRQPRPATGLYENHKVAFMCTYWTNENEFQGKIILGDESGCLMVVDSRVPNQFLSWAKALDRPLRKIKPQGNNFAISGQSTDLKIYKSNETDGLECIYENKAATNLIRDICWNPWEENYVFSTGWDAKLSSHKF